MSCTTVVLLCDWCQKMPVGTSHCCPETGHGILCGECAAAVLAAGPVAPDVEKDLRWCVERELLLKARV